LRLPRLGFTDFEDARDSVALSRRFAINHPQSARRGPKFSGSPLDIVVYHKHSDSWMSGKLDSQPGGHSTFVRLFWSYVQNLKLLEHAERPCAIQVNELAPYERLSLHSQEELLEHR
jgi:hypothetical protein